MIDFRRLSFTGNELRAGILNGRKRPEAVANGQKLPSDRLVAKQ